MTDPQFIGVRLNLQVTRAFENAFDDLLDAPAVREVRPQ
jgi:hypothetical protein